MQLLTRREAPRFVLKKGSARCKLDGEACSLLEHFSEEKNQARYHNHVMVVKVDLRNSEFQLHY